MPNRNAPFGLRPYRHLSGGVGPARPSDRYRIASALAQNIGYGDPVVETGTGTADGRAQITIGNAAGPNTGVFAGCQYKDANGNTVFSKNWVSGTVTANSEPAVAYVYDDPNIVYIAQMSLGFVAANVGLFASLSIAAPNSLGMSTSAIDSAGMAGAEDAVKILSIVQRPGNEIGNYAVVEVLLNDHGTKVEI